MPFDYNLSRIKQQPIFVHEEMRLPKAWRGIGDLFHFNATIMVHFRVVLWQSTLFPFLMRWLCIILLTRMIS